MGDVVRLGAAEHVTSRAPSPSIWAEVPVQELIQNPGKGIFIFEDFKNALVGKETASATDFTVSVGRIDGVIPWYVFVETTKLVDCALQTDDDGVLLLDSDGTDADVVAITSGDNVAASFKTPGIGSTNRLWFEARVKWSAIADDDGGSFIGLSAPGEAKDGGGGMAAGGSAMSDIDHIGFARYSGDGDDIAVVYNEASAGTPSSETGQKVLEADTWYRLGFKVKRESNGSKVRFFIDGVDLGDDVAIDISKTNADYPSDTDMAALLSWIAESGNTDGDSMSVDWVCTAQEYAN